MSLLKKSNTIELLKASTLNNQDLSFDSLHYINYKINKVDIGLFVASKRINMAQLILIMSL